MVDTPELKRENLEALVIENDDFEKLDTAFDRFCPFEAMGVVRWEILVGAYLSKMLNPSEAHGYGSKLLRALMTVAVSTGTAQEFFPMDVHLLELEDAEVISQWIALLRRRYGQHEKADSNDWIFSLFALQLARSFQLS